MSHIKPRKPSHFSLNRRVSETTDSVPVPFSASPYSISVFLPFHDGHPTPALIPGLSPSYSYYMEVLRRWVAINHSLKRRTPAKPVFSRENSERHMTHFIGSFSHFIFFCGNSLLPEIISCELVASQPVLLERVFDAQYFAVLLPGSVTHILK